MTNDSFLVDKAREILSLYRTDKYEHVGAGENKKMAALCAALGISQLTELEWRVEGRRRLFLAYEELVKDSSFQKIAQRIGKNRVNIVITFWLNKR